MKFPFVYETREEDRRQGPTTLTAPDSQFQELLPEKIGWQQAPDPIRQSPFFAHGQKIKPNAHQRITSHINLQFGMWEDITFSVGKLIGYYKVPTYAGGQLPSVIRANIQPGQPTTYGSIYEVPSPVVSPAGFYTAQGFQSVGIDGDPYY